MSRAARCASSWATTAASSRTSASSTNRRRISYSADGSAAYRLPEEAVGVAAVQVSGESLDSPGSFDAESRVYTFRTPPAAGTDNVEITYLAASSDRAV